MRGGAGPFRGVGHSLPPRYPDTMGVSAAESKKMAVVRMGLPEDEVVKDEIACSHMSPGTHQYESGRLFFTTNYLCWIGVLQTRIPIPYSKIRKATAEGGQVIVRTDETRHSFKPDFRSQCERIVTFIHRGQNSQGVGILDTSFRGNDVAATGLVSPMATTPPNDEPDEIPPADIRNENVSSAMRTLPHKDPVKPEHFVDPAALREKENQLFTITLPRTIGFARLIDAMFGRGGVKFMRTYHGRQKDTDINVASWNYADEGKWGGTRRLTCRSAEKRDFVQSQRMVVTKEDSGRWLCFQGSGQCPEVTYGDTFRVDTMMDIRQPAPGQPIRITYYGKLRFLTDVNGIVSRFIKNGTAKGLKDSSKVLENLIMETATALQRSTPPQSPAAVVSQSTTPRNDAALPVSPTPMEDDVAAPPPDSEGKALPWHYITVATIAIMVVLCWWTSSSLARAQERLVLSRKSNPTYAFNSLLKQMEEDQRRMWAIKKALEAPSTAAILSKLTGSQRADFTGRIREIRNGLYPFTQLLRSDGVGGPAVEEEKEGGKPDTVESKEAKETSEVPPIPPNMHVHQHHRHPHPGGQEESHLHQQYRQLLRQLEEVEAQRAKDLEQKDQECKQIHASERDKQQSALRDAEAMVTKQAQKLGELQADIIGRVRILTGLTLTAFLLVVAQVVQGKLSVQA